MHSSSKSPDRPSVSAMLHLLEPRRAELPLLQTAAKDLPGQEYLRSILQVQAEKNLLPIYLQRGYLKAAFAEAEAKVAQENPQETMVDVDFPVDPGRQYKLTQIQWSGNTVFPAEKLQPLIHLADRPICERS